MWLSLMTLRKSGIWQTSQRSRTAPRMPGEFGDLAIAGERLQGAMVVGFARLDEAGQRGPLVEALQQAHRPSRSAAGCCAS